MSGNYPSISPLISPLISPSISPSISEDPAASRPPRAGPDPPAILGAVGMNPFRVRRRSPLDYVFVAASVVVCLALLAWALAG